jgi:hypothetical protein
VLVKQKSKEELEQIVKSNSSMLIAVIRDTTEFDADRIEWMLQIAVEAAQKELTRRKTRERRAMNERHEIEMERR